MLTFSRKSAREAVIVDINEVITRMMHILSRLVGKAIQLKVNLDPEPANIKADPSQIEQVVLNLVVNARDAMQKGGTLTLETRMAFVETTPEALRRSVPPGAYVVLTVSDSGTGMDARTKAQIFEPFFTTKDVGAGTGLGLSTVFGIVKQSGGGVIVESELGRGARFEVSLPRASLPGASTKEPSRNEPLTPSAPNQSSARASQLQN
jgi:signal transduction histidine kinase